MKPDRVEQQAARAIQTVRQAVPEVDLSFFLQLCSSFSNCALAPNTPCIAVIGTGIPEIHLRACGLTPIFLFGGRYCSSEHTVSFFPPISDPTIRSAVEFLVTKGPTQIPSVALSPASTDALKAQNYLQKMGFTVLSLEREIMPQNRMPSAYRDGQMRFLLQLESLSGTALTVKHLSQEVALSTKAHWLLRRLDSSGYPQTLKAFIRQSFYWASDRKEWNRQTESLLAKAPSAVSEDILLLGSSIYFPNSKIYSILEEVGIAQYQNFCSVPYPVDYSNLNQSDCLPALLEQAHLIHYDISRNDACALYGGTVRKASGVIFHLLKGQLQYAYEAERIEKSAIQQGIPFICVETDYNDADYEQVKVRLEGFAELLRQRQNQ